MNNIDYSNQIIESQNNFIDFKKSLTPLEMQIVNTILVFGNFWIAVDDLKLNSYYINHYYSSIRSKYRSNYGN